DNEISYSLGKALGNTPVVVLVNSFGAKELLERQRADGAVGQLLSRVVEKWPSSIFPHAFYPLRVKKSDLAAWRDVESPPAAPSDSLVPSTLRLGRMRSSPFVRAELYGGEGTKHPPPPPPLRPPTNPD